MGGWVVVLASVLWPALSPAQQPPPQPVQPAGIVATSYLYVEPYHSRFEALFSASTFLKWLELPVADPTVPLTPEQQKQVQEKAAAVAAKWCVLRDNGSTVESNPMGVAFVNGVPGRTEPPSKDEVFTVASSMIGLMWEFETSPSPQTIEVQWWGWNQPVTTLPVKIFFGPLTEDVEMSRALPFAKWNNNGRLPPPRPLAQVPPLPPIVTIPVPIASLIWLVIGYAYFVIRDRTGRKPRGGWLGMVIAWLFVAAILAPMAIIRINSPLNETPAVIATPAAAEKIASPLVRNIYHAFDHRTESQIYDALARSVDGELLRKTYLDTMESLSLEGREGSRVKVTEFSLHLDTVKPGPDYSFESEGQWTTAGSVWHWGHTHPRVNRYTARLTIRPVQEAWKITALDVLELRRL